MRGGFGEQLRRWRARAGLSQLALASEAGTTPRHVSFLETGRSRPGAELVLRLARALDVPPRERNAMLAAAGLPAAYPELGLDDPALAPVRRAVDTILAAHDPFPAWAIGRGLRVVAANPAAERLLPGLARATPEQVVDLWFAAGPVRALVENWGDVAAVALASLRRDAASDGALAPLVARAEAHVAAAGGLVDEPAGEALVVAPVLRVGDRRIRTVTSLLRFDTALEVTASELRVELVFPADDDAAAFFRELARAADA